MEDIIEIIKKRLPPGTLIPKPESVSEFRIKDWKGEGADEELAYFIPSHADPSRPSSKRILSRRIRASFARLLSTGEFMRVWFTTTAKNGKAEGGLQLHNCRRDILLFGICRARWTGPMPQSCTARDDS